MSHPGGTLGAMSTQRPGRHCPAPSPGSWVGGPLLGFDTETTGVDPRADRLVTAAIVARSAAGPDGRRQEEILTWLADPGVEIPEAAAGVHGITTERARAQGRPVEQVLEDVADRLASAMSDHVPVVAFNGSYDLTLIESELARHGLATLERRLGRPVGPILDPLVLDRAVDRWRKSKRRLSDMCTVYGVHVNQALHTAEVDVTATLDLLQALAAAHPRVARMSLEDLQSFQAASHRAWAESFNDFLRSKGRTPDADPFWPLAGRG